MNKKNTPPRQTPDRDSRYMGMAWMMAGLSKDPSTQMGACIIDDKNSPLGWGYNGPPENIDDHSFSWERPEKYKFITHAEDNAIDHSNGLLNDSTLYVTGLPCKNCMLDIVKKKIKRVVYMDRDYDSESSQSIKGDIADTFDIAQKGNVEMNKFTGNLGWLSDWVLQLKRMGIFNI